MHSDFETFLNRDVSQFNGYSGNQIVRDSEHRNDDALEVAITSSNARLLLFEGENLLLSDHNGAQSALFEVSHADGLQLRRETLILLGHREGRPMLAGQVAVDTQRPATIQAIDLRSLAIQGILPPDHLGAVAQARSLLNWHSTHTFCARCGAETLIKGGGVRRQCPVCDAQHFPRVDPVAIMVAVDLRQSEPRLLLGRQPRFVEGMYSALAGFLEPGETIEDAVRREIAEEASVKVGRVAYHSSQPWPFPSSLMIGCHAEALSFEIEMDKDELEDVRWFPQSEVRKMIDGSHPEGLRVPPRMAIANRLIAALVPA